MDIPTKSNNLSFNPINIGIDIYPLRKKGVFDIEFNKDRSLREYGNTRGEACGRSLPAGEACGRNHSLSLSY